MAVEWWICNDFIISLSFFVSFLAQRTNKENRMNVNGTILYPNEVDRELFTHIS